MELLHRKVQVGDVGLHLVECGQGPPVLLLHGFPEFWYAWRTLLPELAAHGYRALAPDLRGYGESDKPRPVAAYRSDLLLADIERLIVELGLERVRLVGHDWGASLAFAFAARYPERVERLLILNGAHPNRISEEMRRSDQAFRSLYMLFFQLPWVPEWCLQQREVVEFTFRSLSVNPAVFSAADIDRYQHALCVPGAARGMLNYYRAAARWPLLVSERIEARTLVIWGDADPALGPQNLEGLAAWVPEHRVLHVPDAGHFVHHEKPAIVARAALDFL